MKNIISIFLISCVFLISCSKIRDSAGVNRKNIDEFKVVENPPLIIPPNFNLLPPEQLSEKDIDNAESGLAKEILFGLSEDNKNDSVELSTMDKILNQTNASNTDNNIRQEINEQFASEKQSSIRNWKDESEILDSIAESERLRNERLGIQNKEKTNVPTVKIKNKKKKRFFLF